MKCESCGLEFEGQVGQCPACSTEIKEGELSKELTTQNGSPFDMPAIMDTNIISVAENAEKRLDALQKVKRVALKTTNSHDWVDEGGNPYLQASGAEKIGRVFGISWRVSEPTKENLDGGHYIYTYTGEFALWGAVITAVGTRSSRDGFFKKYKYAGDQRVELPASEIDAGDVKKSAYSNLLANGIKRLLGLRNLTYADLAQYAGINKENITNIERKVGGKAPGKQASGPAQTSQGNGTPASEKQCKAIYAITTDRGITDELARAQKVQSILGLKAAPTSLSKLTMAQASAVIEALNKEAAAATEEA